MTGLLIMCVLITDLPGGHTVPTAKTCIFAYFNFDQKIVEYIAKHFEVIVFHDDKRIWNRVFRKANLLDWRRQRPLTLVYKECLTIFGPGNPWGTLGDSTAGGGATVGGFWHFDSIFRGQTYEVDTFFLMASDRTKYSDSLGRIKAGDANWQYRWAMDYGREYWVNFFACSSKVQCLRNFANRSYDDTYYDGIFMDDILHFNEVFSIFPRQYWSSDYPDESDSVFREAVYSYVEKTCSVYHSSFIPRGNGRRILAVGNINMAWMKEGLWESYLNVLDGGMEETYYADTTLKFEEWRKIVDELRYAESKGKICLVHKLVQSTCTSQYDPFSVSWFDSTQMMYGFGSYLMACDSMSYFSFGGDYEHIFWAPVLDVDIGKPLDSCRVRSDSLAYRHFYKGLVLCNPTGSSKFVQIPVERYYTVKASGDTVTVKNLRLIPHSSIICKLRE